MTVGPFLLQMPDPDKSPARNLVGGWDTYVVYAATAADAQAMAANVGGKVWDNDNLVSPQALSPAANMTGWRLRLTLFDSNDNLITDQTVLASQNNSYASGSVNLTAGQPDASDAFTIAGTEYTFVSAVGASAGNVLIGASAAATLQNLVNAITYDGGAGTNEGTTYIGSGPNAFVTAVVDGVTNTKADITAIEPGTEGNSLGLAATTNVSTHLAVSGADLSGATGLTPTVSGMAEQMVTQLNDAGVGIAHAAYNTSTHVLTVAGSADDIGNYSFQASFYPPNLGFAQAQNADSPNDADDTESDFYQSDYLNTVGVTTVQGFAVPGFVTATSMSGSAGSALTATLVADTYTVPTVLLTARAQQ